MKKYQVEFTREELDFLIYTLDNGGEKSDVHQAVFAKLKNK
jgi:hypothetical protein